TGVWDDATAAKLDAGFRASGASFGAEAAAKVRAALDRKRDKWVAMHREACRATRISGEQSTALLDLRMGCLERRKREIGALVTQLVTAPDAARVAASVEAVAQLPAIDACGDRDALAAVLPPPPDPARRAEIDAVRDEITAINALVWTGQWPDARSRAERVSARAKQLDHAPLVAEAGLARGLAERHAGSYATAEAALTEAAQAAARAHLDEIAARVWAELAWVVGYEQERAPEGLALASAAEATALRASGTPMDLAQVAHTRATILLAKGDQPAALKEAERALALLASGAPAADLETADLLTTQAMVRSAQGDYRAAEAAHRQALARRRAALGDSHPKVADSLDNLGVVLFHQGAFADARKHYEEALALRVAALGPGHRDVGTSHNNLGGLAMDTGDAKAAALHLESALAIYEKALGPTHGDLAIPLSNLGELAARRGDFARSLAYCTRALAIDEAATPDDPKLAYDLVCIGEAQLGAGRPAEAIAPLERALGLRTAAKGDAGELARTQFALARALPASARVRARQLAAQAREGFAGAGDAWKDRLAATDTWLAVPR
ncbi:MAG: tetratricopeptide repeat protein, partial [Myxococcales bacterium]|nr:tetratricopeptide repeat protein [Myxococcales bacterium]